MCFSWKLSTNYDFHFSADRTRYECEVCDKIFFGKKQLEGHLQSRRHRKSVNRKRKFESNEEKSYKVTNFQKSCSQPSLQSLNFFRSMYLILTEIFRKKTLIEYYLM